MNNFVAKHARTFNKAHVHRDRTKYHRPSNNDLLAEWYDETEELDYPGLADPKEFETPSISANVNRSGFNNRRQRWTLN